MGTTVLHDGHVVVMHFSSAWCFGCRACVKQIRSAHTRQKGVPGEDSAPAPHSPLICPACGLASQGSPAWLLPAHISQNAVNFRLHSRFWFCRNGTRLRSMSQMRLTVISLPLCQFVAIQPNLQRSGAISCLRPCLSSL